MTAKWAVAIAMIGLLGAAHPKPRPAPTPPISIVINGDVLPVEPPPIVRKGILYVPVRRTIEALGLDFVKQGKHITTQVGARTVSLSIGSRVATIDGSTVMLDAAPFEVKYVLYTPLRYFTDVLGAQATFDRKEGTVTIVAQLVGRSGAGVIQEGKNNVQRFGTVTGIDLNSNPPTVTLTYNASVHTTPITPNAIIEMHDVDANVVVPGELGDVRPGDFARIYMQNNGNVSRVEDAYGSHTGTIAAVVSNQFVLNDGHVITPARTTQISLNGKPAQITDLQVGDGVTVRYNVVSNEIREVLASRSGNTAPAASGTVHIQSVTLDADHPLRTGDHFTVMVQGTAGGAATFDIGPYVSNLAMAERSPGTYVASYTIPNGANFTDVPIIAHLRAGDTTAPDVQATQTLSASSTPPGISDFAPDNGATVNTKHPAIYATFASAAVPVNPSSITMWVNGRDVTAGAERTPYFIQYMPEYSYPSGPVRVTVRVADKAGNTTTKSWTFNITR